ncbi:MAG: GTP cyclohydrolase I FolE [Crenarchaeota archaeon]|nr:GTP cyclohydrolase I FolE [Thermoproteota archaeon]
MNEKTDQQKIEDAIREILKAVGVKEDTETYRNTPRRVAKMYLELFSGMSEDEPKITFFENNGYSDIITLKKIPFYSICAHHLLPIFGEVSVAYIPDDKIVGLSKIPRVVRYFASRLQLQEEFTKDLADYLYKKLRAKGVFVMVKARHLCLEMRGAKAPNVETVSSAMRGVFETSAPTKYEAIQLLM